MSFAENMLFTLKQQESISRPLWNFKWKDGSRERNGGTRLSLDTSPEKQSGRRRTLFWSTLRGKWSVNHGLLNKTHYPSLMFRNSPSVSFSVSLSCHHFCSYKPDHGGDETLYNLKFVGTCTSHTNLSKPFFLSEQLLRWCPGHISLSNQTQKYFYIEFYILIRATTSWIIKLFGIHLNSKSVQAYLCVIKTLLKL